MELRSTQECPVIVPHHYLRAGGNARVRTSRWTRAGDQAARRRAEEYLLQRGLFRRRSTGEVADPAFLELAFPPRYHYDVLRALDYFRAAGVALDPRISDAAHFLESKRQADGRWLLDRAYDEPLAVPTGESVGEPSRWNTLRALRVLRWYHRAAQAGPTI